MNANNLIMAGFISFWLVVLVIIFVLPQPTESNPNIHRVQIGNAKYVVNEFYVGGKCYKAFRSRRAGFAVPCK